jgi:uncharacterized protein DUF1553/uncharacterized protein DUF1549
MATEEWIGVQSPRRRCEESAWRPRPLIMLLPLLAACGSGGTGESEEVGPPIVHEAPPEFWSFSRPTRPDLPAVGDASWLKNPIDGFVLQKLDEKGLEPAAPAEAEVMLRRLTLDLTGLPPAPEEVRAFAADPSDEAYEAQVDRLLETQAFGEHRARYWLDVARYADTHGYHYDNYRSIWPYRDYVIDAFASGKPFDVFTVEQLAGDLLPDAGVEQQIATGFIRSGMSTNEEGVEADEYAAIYAKDRVDTLASTWLGLTVGCAACHDHRYDPIKQRDFYALTAFFRNTTQPILDGNVADSPPSILVPPAMVPTLIADEKDEVPFAHVLERGRYEAPGERVEADVPASLPPLPSGEPRNRLGLARWLTAPDNPLMARVVVNRFWSEVFGAGLVRSVNDFGRIGDPPSHPELLDWLAVEFVESGWDVKHLFRLMVTSATYRQSAQVSPDKLTLDADNRLLSRGPRFRMDGEMVRDLALAASGLLVRIVGGPSVKPYQPENVWEVVSPISGDTYSYVQDQGAALYRRSLYTFWKRQAPPPAMEVFNAPNREESVPQRERTNTPLQALVTLNDVQFVEAARVLATTALAVSDAAAGRLDFMAQRVLSRSLTEAEAGELGALADEQLALYTQDPEAADALIHMGDSAPRRELDASELAAWTLVASTMLNLDEALNK